MLTYKTFTNSRALANRLIRRYNTNNLNHNVNVINNDRYSIENGRKIQINVTNVLREWIKHYCVLDFKSNTTSQSVILDFAQNKKAKAKYKNLEQVMKFYFAFKVVLMLDADSKVCCCCILFAFFFSFHCCHPCAKKTK